MGHGDFSLIATNQALGPSFLNSSGQVQCGTPASPISYGTAPGSCVSWNPFIPAGSTGEGALSSSNVQQFLFPYFHDTGRTKTTDYSASLTGSVFTLPAGDLSVAAGFEYRREDGNFVPDAFSQAGVSSNLSSGPIRGSYNVKEYYVEVDIPLLKDQPFARELTLDLAARHSRYNTFGSTTNPKYSLTWRPIDELLVRGTFAKGFHAPSIHDLFGGISGTFDYHTDPCSINQEAGSNPAVAQRCSTGFGGQAPVPTNYKQLGQGGIVCTSFPCQTGTQFFSGASPTLQPETAISRTAGLVYSPTWVWIPGKLDLTLDWYKIRINNAMTGDSVSSMLNDCYVLGVASRCSSLLFARDPTTGALNYALRGLKNAGWEEAEGWDFGVRYLLPQTSFGLFRLTWNTTYVSQLNYKADNSPATPVSPSNSWGGNFRIRSNASLDWSLGDFGATWTTRYYSSMRERCSWDNTPQGGPECNMPGYVLNNVVFNVNRTGANTFHDAQFRYTAPWKGTISVGVNSVFGHWAAPMYSNPSSQYAYYGGFDVGRFYYLYLRYNQKFRDPRQEVFNRAAPQTGPLFSPRLMFRGCIPPHAPIDVSLGGSCRYPCAASIQCRSKAGQLRLVPPPFTERPVVQRRAHLRRAQGRAGRRIAGDVGAARFPIQPAEAEHLAQGGFRFAHQSVIGHIQDRARHDPVPVRQHAPIIVVVLRQRTEVVAVGAGVAEVSAPVGETRIHRIAHQVEDRRTRQRGMDRRGQNPVGRLLVDKEPPAVCTPLRSGKIAAAKFDVIETGQARQQRVALGVPGVGHPVQLRAEVHQLACHRDLRMIAEHAFEQGGAGTRHADDEDGRRGRCSTGVARHIHVPPHRQEPVQPRVMARGLTTQARVHQRVRMCQRVPCFAIAVQILQSLVARKLEGCPIGTMRRRGGRARFDHGEVVVIRRLLAQPHQRHRDPATHGRFGEACSQFDFGLLDQAVDHQRFAAMETQGGGLVAEGLGLVQQGQRLDMLLQSFAQGRQSHQRQRVLAIDFRRAIQTFARRNTLARFQQHARNGT